MKLTKKIVEKLALPETGQKFVWDDAISGFGIRLTQAGRTYIAQARVNGDTRRVTIGRHGVLTLEEARKQARIELAKMTNGVDPVAEKQKRIAFSLTLEELTKAYITAHRDLKQRSIDDINRHVTTNFRMWKTKPVATEITREAVLTRFQEIATRSGAQANQAFRILRALLNYAMAAYRPDNRPLLIENPVNVLSQTKVWSKIRAKSRRIPSAHVGQAWNTIQSLRSAFATTVGRTAADLTAFMLLTGCRLGEASQLEWDRVNLEEKWWFLPDPKNRNPLKLPLSDVLVELLSDRKKKATGAYVFPARSGEGHHIKDVRDTVAKLGISPHDLRRTFRHIGEMEAGVVYWKVKALMGHKLGGDVTLQSYTEKTDLTYLNKEINAIATWVVEQAAIAASEKVVRMPRKSA